MSLPAYRAVLRAARTAFQGDTPVLTAARHEARRAFESNRSLVGDEAKALLEHAHEVARVLRTNVIQGRRTEEGIYKLNIHDEIERGDNESIKMPTSTLGVGMGGGKCCSS